MENENQENTVPQTPTTDLTVSDLVNIRAVIEAAVKRGAFQASELSSVGAAYDKLSKFLASVASQNQENK